MSDVVIRYTRTLGEWVCERCGCTNASWMFGCPCNSPATYAVNSTKGPVDPRTLSGTWPGEPDDGFEQDIDEHRHGRLTP